MRTHSLYMTSPRTGYAELRTVNSGCVQNSDLEGTRARLGMGRLESNPPVQGRDYENS